MPKITVLPHNELCPNGAEFNGSQGDNICKALLTNGIAIEHACELSCACTTCHVVIKQGMASLNEISENEEDLLDMAWGLTRNSRLSCQTIIGSQELIIEIPKYTINHAKET